MDLITGIFRNLVRNVIRCFSGRNLLWHALAIALTLALTLSGFDWWYFGATRSGFAQSAGFVPAIAGFFVPLLLPVLLYAFGVIGKKKKLRVIASAVAQAEIIGWFISSAYKAFTGRIPPPHEALAQITTTFNFGFWRGGIFWGWPSSHTAVAFAMAGALWTLIPSKIVRFTVALYALFIGLGVSVTIHWFSDFVAGAIIGSVIGVVVGRSFRSA